MQHTNDYIANSTITAARDTVLTGAILMKAGTQLIVPVNLDQYWTTNSFITYSLPVSIFKSILNLSSGLTYSHTPGLVNLFENFTNTYTISAGSVPEQQHQSGC